MERVEAMIDPVLYEEIKEYESEEGYENLSQALRAIIRDGLNVDNPSEERIAELVIDKFDSSELDDL